MLPMKILLKLSILIALASNSAFAKQDDSIKVLFVGNSYSYFWNMPQMVASMARSQGIEIITQQSTIGGANLEEHWQGKKTAKTKALIAQGDWDFVVFNDRSLSAIKDPNKFFEYGKKFANLTQTHGAKPVFYLTWARKYAPQQQAQISKSYRLLADQTEALLVPVGEVWQQVLKQRAEINLYHPDGSHPSPSGAYLSALLFYKYISGKSVLTIPNRLTASDSNQEQYYLSFIYPEYGDYLRQLVNEY